MTDVLRPFVLDACVSLILSRCPCTYDLLTIFVNIPFFKIIYYSKWHWYFLHYLFLEQMAGHTFFSENNKKLNQIGNLNIKLQNATIYQTPIFINNWCKMRIQMYNLWLVKKAQLDILANDLFRIVFETMTLKIP